MRTAALIGYYGKNNWGDNLFNILIPHFFITHCSLGVNVYSDCADSAMNFPVTDRSKHFPSENIIIIGGGALINRDFWAFNSKLSLLNNKVIFFNVEINEGADSIIDDLRAINALWVVRNISSVHYLKNHNFDLSNIHYAPDITIPYFHNAAAPIAKNLSVCLNYNIFSGLFSRIHDIKIRAEIAYLELTKFLIKMRDWGWNITLLPAQTSNWIDDRLSNGYLAGLLRNNGVYCNIINDEREIRKTLDESSFIISSRYHFSAFAIANKIPLIDINFHSKNRNLLVENGLQHCMVDYYNFNCEDLVKAAQFSECSEEFIKNSENLCKISKEAWNKLPNIINEFLNK